MPQHIEVVYENGVLRPLRPLPSQFHEHQHLTVIVKGVHSADDWLAEADPTVSLEEVRRALAKIPGTLAQAVDAEREER
jgi:predicted DNA-binding antitoxin AbrB/MazE fold protein